MVTRRDVLGGAAVVTGALLTAPALAQASGMREFEHDAGTTAIPVNPHRIVSLHDISQTLPLIEYSKPPVGSAGRTAADGSRFLLAGYSLTGTDFHNSDIVPVDRSDFEGIAALGPDLITTNSADDLDRLSLIAPTIVLNRDNNPGLAQLRKVADAAGVLDRYAALETRFNWQIERLHRVLPNPGEIVVSLVTPEHGALSAHKHATRGSIGYVLAQLGFKEPEVVQAIEKGDAQLSGERIEELDGDFIIGSMGSDDATPSHVYASMEALSPGWSNALHAPRNNQFVILQRDEALALSFSAFDLMEMIIVSNIAGRGYVKYDA